MSKSKPKKDFKQAIADLHLELTSSQSECRCDTCKKSGKNQARNADKEATQEKATGGA